ncbi:MAG: hypothetical protein QW197_01070 [Candidatus Aenigmatarchaeota archaeon]
MEKVLLDTNFLVYLIKEKKFQLFEDFLNQNLGNYKIYIFEATLAEIGNISKNVLKEVKLLIKNGKIEVIKIKGKVDELILKYKDEYIVATEDKELSKQIKRRIVKTKKYFQINY